MTAWVISLHPPPGLLTECRECLSLHQSLLSRARGPGSSSRRVALFKNVEPAGKSIMNSSSRRQPAPMVNFNPFTPDPVLIQSATQQRNNRKRAHWNEYGSPFLPKNFIVFCFVLFFFFKLYGVSLKNSFICWTRNLPLGFFVFFLAS